MAGLIVNPALDNPDQAISEHLVLYPAEGGRGWPKGKLPVGHTRNWRPEAAKGFKIRVEQYLEKLRSGKRWVVQALLCYMQNEFFESRLPVRYRKFKVKICRVPSLWHWRSGVHY